MYQGNCLCGAIRWQFSGTIESVTACNCTACSRYGVLWAYGHENVEIKISGSTHFYARPNNSLEFHFCPSCACLTHWRGTKLIKNGLRRMAVNTRLIQAPEQIAALPIDHFDGLDTFTDLPRDERCVRDMWF